MELGSGQPCALEQGTGLVSKHLEVIAPLLPQVDGRCGGAVLHGSQLTGVAVGQQSPTRLHQLQTVFPNLPAHPNILIVDVLALLEQLGADAVHRVQLFDRPFHPLQRPAQVHRRGAGGGQIFGGVMEFYTEIVGVSGLNLPCGQIQPVGGGHPDGGGAPHLQGLDGVPDFCLGAQV